jgi:triacylglycerol lipase
MEKRPEPAKLWRNVFYPLPNYTYFEKPPAFDSAVMIGKLNVLKAAWMVDAAMLAYNRSGPDPIPLQRFAKILELAGFVHFDLIGDWSGGPKGTQAYFAYARDFAVLAFRGTEKDDWTDLAADLATWPVAVDRSEVNVGDAQKTMFHLPSAAGVFDHAKPAVHRGFQVALNQVWKDIERKLADYRAQSTNEIFFTGHSLGAALATLAVSRFAGGNASLYTFGSPRVGNQGFVDGLSRFPQFRFVDLNDLVTRVPPALFSYGHGAATLFHLDATGEIRDQTAAPAAGAGDLAELQRDMKCLAELHFPIGLDTVPPDDLYDHSPGRYANRIWNALAC